MTDYYEVLGISSNASKAEIRDAYRRLALYYHPDRNYSFEAEEEFKKISEAYAILSNDESRQQYDQLLDSEIDNEYVSEDTFREVDFDDILQESPKAPRPWIFISILLLICIPLFFVAIWYSLNGLPQVMWRSGGTPSMSTMLLTEILAVVVIIPIVIAVAIVTRMRTKRPHPTKYYVEFCYYCGASIPIGANFCSNCGKYQA